MEEFHYYNNNNNKNPGLENLGETSDLSSFADEYTVCITCNTHQNSTSVWDCLVKLHFLGQQGVQKARLQREQVAQIFLPLPTTLIFPTNKGNCCVHEISVEVRAFYHK